MFYQTHSLGWLGEYGRAAKRFIFLIFFVPVCLSAETDLPVLTTDTQLANAGYYQLSWQPGISGASSKNLHFEIQQSSDKLFAPVRTIYRGSDRASVISGQADGDYYYRARVIRSNKSMSGWSNTVLVRVQHHSINKAWLFFFMGAIVFFITLSFIVVASRKNEMI